MEAIMIGFAVGIVVGISVVVAVGASVVVAAAIFTSIDVFLALSAEKTARGRKPKYFNIGYKAEYGTKFCRAHFVCKLDKSKPKVLYLVEIHPEDAAKAHAWTVPEAELCGGQLLEKGRFYRYAFKEELYD